jgi:hypothetical protein
MRTALLAIPLALAPAFAAHGQSAHAAHAPAAAAAAGRIRNVVLVHGAYADGSRCRCCPSPAGWRR